MSKPWFPPRPRQMPGSSLRIARALAVRSSIVGAGLWLMLTPDPSRNLRHCALAYLVLLVWCYYDPLVRQRRWRTASWLAFAVYLVSVQFGRLLATAFGAPALSTTTNLLAVG